MDRGERHAQAPARPPKPAGRGTRIPDDFAVTADLAEWARAETPHVDTRLETAKFIDYWRSATGQRATKRDWPATWRNWMRRTGDSPPRASPNGTRPSTTDQRVAAVQALKIRTPGELA